MLAAKKSPESLLAGLMNDLGASSPIQATARSNDCLDLSDEVLPLQPGAAVSDSNVPAADAPLSTLACAVFWMFLLPLDHRSIGEHFDGVHSARKEQRDHTQPFLTPERWSDMARIVVTQSLDSRFLHGSQDWRAPFRR